MRHHRKWRTLLWRLASTPAAASRSTASKTLVGSRPLFVLRGKLFRNRSVATIDGSCGCRRDEFLEPGLLVSDFLSDRRSASGKLGCEPVDASVTDHEPVIDQFSAQGGDVVMGFAKQLVDLRFRVSAAGSKSFQQEA